MCCAHIVLTPPVLKVWRKEDSSGIYDLYKYIVMAPGLKLILRVLHIYTVHDAAVLCTLCSSILL